MDVYIQAAGVSCQLECLVQVGRPLSRRVTEAAEPHLKGAHPRFSSPCRRGRPDEPRGKVPTFALLQQWFADTLFLEKQKDG
jgi:hypothetical protein